LYVFSILLIVLAFIIVLLCIPFEIELLVLFDKPKAFRWRINYFFNLITWEIVQKNKGDTTKEQSSRKADTFSILKVKGLIEQVIIFLKHLFHAVKFHHMRSDIRYSLGEDHYTGLVCGYVYAALPLINIITGSNLQAQPVFEDELKLEGYFRGNIQVRPIQIAYPCLAFMCSKPVWQAGSILIRKQWKKK
jgi:hypothetical protein